MCDYKVGIPSQFKNKMEEKLSQHVPAIPVKSRYSLHTIGCKVKGLKNTRGFKKNLEKLNRCRYIAIIFLDLFSFILW